MTALIQISTSITEDELMDKSSPIGPIGGALLNLESAVDALRNPGSDFRTAHVLREAIREIEAALGLIRQ